MKNWYPEADLVIQHPKIYTVAITCEEVREGKRDFPIIEDGGVAAKDGKIIAVGSAADVEQFIGEHTNVVDATDQILTPGFIECHMHAKWSGEQMLNLDFQGWKSRQAPRTPPTACGSRAMATTSSSGRTARSSSVVANSTRSPRTTPCSCFT